MAYCELFELLIKKGLASGSCEYSDSCSGARCINPIAINHIDQSELRAWTDQDAEQEAILQALERVKNKAINN